MASTINAKTTGTGGIEYTADASGEIELQSDGVTKAKVTANGLQDANGNSLRGGMYRNLVINGDMRIAQKGTSTTGVTTGYNNIDRWRYQTVGSVSAVLDMSQDTDVPLGQGFVNSLKLNVTTAQSSMNAGDTVRFEQKIEAQNLQHLKYGTSSAETITLSFWVKSNVTGTLIIWIYSPDPNRAISKAIIINTSDTWEKKTVTFDGDTVGSINNDNGEGFRLGFNLAAGTDFSSGTLQTSWGSNSSPNRLVGQTNFLASTSNYINVTGVQLEVGEGASDFEFLPYDVQLTRCQRYYFIDSPVRIKTYSVSGSNNSVSRYTFPTTMRTTPTITITTGTTSNLSSASTNQTSNNATSITLIASSAGTVSIGDSSDGAIELNAEL